MCCSFLPQVWQNVLQLWQYTKKPMYSADGRVIRFELQPAKRFLLDRNMAAALFVKFGFNKEGLLPYTVFIEAICSTPSR